MEENQPHNFVHQPTLQQLPDDPLRNIFHRLPSDPRALAFVSATFKAWRRVVHDEDNFLRPFRKAHSNAPPLLGLFTDAVYGELPFTPSTNSGVVNLPAPPPPLFHTYGCTHGRLLLHDNNGEFLLVWDPLTGGEHLIPSPPPGFQPWQTCGAALVCDADHANAGDCHSSPFRVVFAYSDVPPGGWHAPMAPVQTFVCVYNSETGSWGGSPVASISVGNHFDYKLSAVAVNGAAVFWMTQEESAVLEFDVDTQELTLTGTPEGIRGMGFVLAPTMDARLGLAGVIGGSVVLSWWEDNAWADRVVVRLEEILPFHQYDDEYENGGDDEPDENGGDDWDEPDEYEHGGHGLLRFQIGHAGYSDSDDENLEAPMGPRVLGFSQDMNSVFLQAEPPGVFIINLESGHHRRVLETDQRLSRVYPYSSFYTAAGKAVLNDVQVVQENDSIQSGGKINVIKVKSTDGGIV